MCRRTLGPGQRADDRHVAVPFPRDPAQRHHDQVDGRLAEHHGFQPHAHRQLVGVDDEFQQARGSAIIDGQCEPGGSGAEDA